MARPKQVTDEKLLKVALKCFLVYGHEVSTQIIADQVGLSQPALFKRFGTKEEMFLRAVAPPEDLPILDWLDASPTSEPFRPQLVELLKKVGETLSWVLPRVQLLRAARIPREIVMSRYKVPPPDRLMISVAGFFERVRQQGQLRKVVDPRLASQWVFGLNMGGNFLVETMPHKIGSKENAEFVESAADMLCNGIIEDKGGG